MTTWKQAKLFGGPLDGAQFELEFDPPPEMLNVMLCSRCGGYHHAPANAFNDMFRPPPPEAVTYKLHRIDKEARIAYYREKGIKKPGPGGLEKEIDRERELELV